MSLSAALLAEFDHEMANTRKTLERVPEDRLDFSPHDRSFDLLQLAGHIANIPSWTKTILTTSELDVSGPFDRPSIESKSDILATFDQTLAEAREALSAASDEDLMVEWSLIMDGEPVFTMPRGAVLRSFVMNHNIHHRGQLTVYLRLVGAPVPALYGPSADEQG